jgi:hypothetical protein
MIPTTKRFSQYPKFKEDELVAVLASAVALLLEGTTSNVAIINVILIIKKSLNLVFIQFSFVYFLTINFSRGPHSGARLSTP